MFSAKISVLKLKKRKKKKFPEFETVYGMP